MSKKNNEARGFSLSFTTHRADNQAEVTPETKEGRYFIVSKDFINDLIKLITNKESKISKPAIRCIALGLEYSRQKQAGQRADKQESEQEYIKGHIEDNFNYESRNILFRKIAEKERFRKIVDSFFKKHIPEFEQLANYSLKKELKAIPKKFLDLSIQGKINLSAFLFGLVYYANRINSRHTMGLLLKNQPYATIQLTKIANDLGIQRKVLREGREQLIRLGLIQALPFQNLDKKTFSKKDKNIYYRKNPQGQIYKPSLPLEDSYLICQDWIQPAREVLIKENKEKHKQGFYKEQKEKANKQKKEKQINESKQVNEIQAELLKLVPEPLAEIEKTKKITKGQPLTRLELHTITLERLKADKERDKVKDDFMQMLDSK